MSRALPLLLALCLLALPGCGKKGPLKPLTPAVPAAPAKVELRQQGAGFLLSWRLPEKNLDGSPVREPLEFVVQRAVFTASDSCNDCPPRWQPLTRLATDAPEPAARRGDLFWLTDTAVAVGSGYRYRITALTGRGRAGGSAEVKGVMQPPPVAPAQLSAEGRDHLVRLRWSAVAVPGVAYQVYRRPVDGIFPPGPLNPQPLPEPRYDDFAVDNNTRYIYGVRSIVRSAGAAVESVLSPLVRVQPQSES